MKTKVGIGIYSLGEALEKCFIGVSITEGNENDIELMTSGVFKADYLINKYLSEYLTSVKESHCDAEFYLNYFTELGVNTFEDIVNYIDALPFNINLIKLNSIDQENSNPTYSLLNKNYPFYNNLSKEESKAAWLSFNAIM